MTPSDIGNLLKTYSKDRARFIIEYRLLDPSATPADCGALWDAVNGGTATSSASLSNSNQPLNVMTVLRQALEAQSEKGVSSTYLGEVTKLQEGLDIFFDKSTGQVNTLEDMFKNVLRTSITQIITVYEQMADLQTKINTETGLTGKLSEAFRKDIMESTVYAARLGLTFQDIAGMVSQIVTDSGRFKLLSSETIDKVTLMSRVAFKDVSTAADSIETFQKVSRGASDAMESVEKVALSTLQLGLNAKKATETLVTNVDKLNQYGFKNGIEGLTRMVQKAQQLRLDLSASFNLAEKVMDPKNALSLAANLQVIGGALGDFNDPIRMMWMATNNVEGLQDALAESAESLVTFNQESGVFEVVGADLRRARAMADELGMSLGDLTNLAVQSAQRTSAAADLMSTGLVFKNEDDKEFLTNLAQMKGGKMVIEVPEDLRKKFGQTDIALENLTETQKNEILQFRKQFEDMTAEDIATQQVNSIRNIERNLNFVAARMRIEAGKRGEDIVKALGYDPLEVIAQTQEFTNKLQSGMLDLSGDIGKMVEKYIPEGTKTTTPTTPTTASATSTTANINMTVTGDANMDVIMRELRNNPEFAERLIRDYLNSQPVRD